MGDLGGAFTQGRPFIMSAPIARTGYRFVASDGGMFTYGTGAPFLGSMGGSTSTSPSWAWRSCPRVTATTWWPLTGESSATDRPGSTARPGRPPQRAHRRYGGDRGRGGLLARGLRRWDLQLRRRPVLRVDGIDPPQQAHRRHGGHPDGKGYYLVASDGGIFNYGDATF